VANEFLSGSGSTRAGAPQAHRKAHCPKRRATTRKTFENFSVIGVKLVFSNAAYQGA
jgi:hypothetical protein